MEKYDVMNTKKHELAGLHKELVRQGKLDIAKRVLVLMIKGSVCLYLSPTDEQAEMYLRRLGIREDTRFGFPLRITFFTRWTDKLAKNPAEYYSQY